jgi:hypothetical protein
MPSWKANCHDKEKIISRDVLVGGCIGRWKSAGGRTSATIPFSGPLIHKFGFD